MPHVPQPLKKIFIFLKNRLLLVLQAFQKTILFFWHTYEKFDRDEGFSKTSAIAYTTIVSLIPTLTVGLTFYSLATGLSSKKEEFFRRILVFLQEHNININVDQIFEVLSSLVENAAKIGGIGLVVLIFSATATLRTVDQALNRIWRVRKERPLLQQIVYYWAALTLGPILLISGTTLAAKISSFFSPPSYHALSKTPQNHLFLSGSNHTLGFWEQNQLTPLTIILDQIKISYSYQLEPEPPYFSLSKENLLSEKTLKKLNFTSILAEDKGYWLVSDTGYLFYSANQGQDWNAYRFGNLQFTKILSTKNGLIASAKNGYLLHSVEEGKNWRLIRWPGISSDFNDLAFDGKFFWIAGSDGLLLKTTKDFNRFEVLSLPQVKKQNRKLGLKSIQYAGEHELYIAGEEGLLLRGDTRKPSPQWENLSYSKNNFFALRKISSGKLLAVGEEGKIVHSSNNGLNWEEKKLNQDDLSGIFETDGQVYILGKMETLIKTDSHLKHWEIHQNKSYIIMLANFFGPFALIWILFLVLYRVLPNTKVPLKSAAWGAAFTSMVWVFFVLLFILYVRSFSYGTFAIYGALTALPISLLLIYSSVLIFLFGAEVAFLHAHPHFLSHHPSEGEKRFELPYFSVLIFLFAHFHRGKGLLSFKELQKTLNLPAHSLERIIEKFKKVELIHETDTGYLPIRPADQISLLELNSKMPDILQSAMTEKGFPENSPWLLEMRNKWLELLNKSLSEKSLAELLKKKA